MKYIAICLLMINLSGFVAGQQVFHQGYNQVALDNKVAYKIIPVLPKDMTNKIKLQRLDQSKWISIGNSTGLLPLTEQEKWLASYFRSEWKYLMNTQISDFEILGIAALLPAKKQRYAQLFFQNRTLLLKQVFEFQAQLQKVALQRSND